MAAPKNQSSGRRRPKAGAPRTKSTAPRRAGNGARPDIDTPLSNVPSTPNPHRLSVSNHRDVVTVEATRQISPAVNIGAEIEGVDADAVEIAALYLRGRNSLVASAEALLECGRKLAEKKATLAHGKWLPWLQANEAILGFETDRTAQRLMKAAAANPTPSVGFGEVEALKISRATWGHLGPKVRRADLETSKPTRTSRATADADECVAARKYYLECVEALPDINLEAEEEIIVDGLREIARRRGR